MQPNVKEALNEAVGKMSGIKPATLKPALKHMQKMLQALKQKPEEEKNRRFRMDNIVIKKFVLDIQGGADLMKAVGFSVREIGSGAKKPQYLEIEASEVRQPTVEAAVDMLEKKLKELDTPAAAPKPSGPRQLCAGGCGFFGDEQTEGYCSQCHRKKLVGTKPPASAASAASEAKSGATGKPCTKGCGFYGLEKFRGMCSGCWGKEQKAARHWKRRLRIAFIKVRAVHRFRKGNKQPQVDRKRCFKCNKKVGILGIDCRCGNVFCGLHRYPQEHGCLFDHRAVHMDKLRRENQLIASKKLDKIDD